MLSNPYFLVTIHFISPLYPSSDADDKFQVIQWMQDPTPASQMESFQAWNKCEVPIPLEKQACNIPRVCKLFSRELRRERYLYTCKECPQTYPWIKNEFGLDFYK